jgi:hypothetical protein
MDTATQGKVKADEVGAAAPKKAQAATPKRSATVARKGRPTAKAKPTAAKPAAAPVAKAAKGVQAARPVKAETSAKQPKPAKPAKTKLVRDSFTMPQADYDLVQVLKDRALAFKRPTKKSELLRAGLQALVRLDDAALQAQLAALPALKPGRPKQGH